jgi:hypothetical protein
METLVGTNTFSGVFDCCEVCCLWPQLVENVVNLIHLLNGNSTRICKILILCKINQPAESENLASNIELLMRSLASPSVYDEILDELWSVETELDRGKLKELLTQCSVEKVFEILPDRLGPMLAKMASTGDGRLDTVPRRLDALEILYILVTRQQQQPQAMCDSEMLESLIESVLIENMRWRPGETNNKLRKTAVFVFIMATQNNFGGKKCMQKNLEIISSVIDDIWSPDSRYLAMYLVKEAIRNFGSVDRPLIDAILLRLDDKHSEIQVEAAEALTLYMDHGGLLAEEQRKEGMRLVRAICEISNDIRGNFLLSRLGP